MRRHVAAVAAALGVILLGHPSSAGGNFPDPSITPMPVWSAPMRLGRTTPLDAGNPAADGPSTKQPDQCAKWQAMSAQLGETFAGHMVRDRVLHRVCGNAGRSLETTAWNWPWDSLGRANQLPPHLQGQYGAWQIRCGAVGAKNRCALISRVDGSLDPSQFRRAAPAYAHFVIDMVRGQESVLWRLLVPQAREAARVATSDAPAVASIGATVRYRLGSTDREERFVTCGAAGCLMEAAPSSASRVAQTLWDGFSLDVAIGGADVSPPVQLRPEGFRNALSALIRLRQKEWSPQRVSQ